MARVATPPQSDVGRPPLLLVVASQLVERLDQGGHLGVLASELGIFKVVPEVLPERLVVTHGSRTLAVDGGGFAVVL
jgi:hypothetical protein